MHVCWDIQLALELIVVQVELGQIDEVAELLGQFTCTKNGMSAKRIHACMMEHTNDLRMKHRDSPPGRAQSGGHDDPTFVTSAP